MSLLIYPVEVYIDHRLRERFPDAVVAVRRHCGMPHWYIGGEPKRGGWIRCPGADGWMQAPFRLWLTRGSGSRSIGYTSRGELNPTFVRVDDDKRSWESAVGRVMRAADDALVGWSLV